MPRAFTPKEIQTRFLNHLRLMSQYWAKQPDMTPEERCDGVTFSILCYIDGVSGGFPRVILAVDPHPDDKEYYQNNGENWYEPNTVFNDTMLHDLYHPR
jgi:hypothetical protein